jgi:phage tail-like protein
MRPTEENADPPRVSAVLPLPAPEYYVAIAGDGAGRFAVLSWIKNAEDNTAVRIRTFDSMTAFDRTFTLTGVTFPYSIAWLENDQVALLASQNKKAFVYSLDTPDDDIAPTGDSYVLAAVNPGPFAHGFTQPPHDNVGGEIFPLLPLSLNSLAPSGSARGAQPLDSGASRTVWHRIFLEASLPPRCGVVVWLAASDDPGALADPKTKWYPHLVGDAEVPADFAEAPRAVWQRTPSEVPFHPGLLGEKPLQDRQGLFMALIQRAGVAVRALRGRYLGIRIDLVGDGRRTPEIAALRVYASRFSYVERYLPELYRENTFGPERDASGPSTRPDFLERFVDIFEAPMTQIEDRIAASYLLTHPGSAPDDGLDWLGSWIGVTPDPLPPERRRAQLRAATRLYRERGTVKGITEAIDVATGGLCRRGAVIVIEDYRLRHTFATILGADLDIEEDPLLPGAWQSSNSFVGNTLFLGDEHRKEFLSLFSDAIRTAQEQAQVDAFFDQLAHRMTVFVHDQVETVDLQLVRRIVEREKPAHVAVGYLRASQPFLIGMASLLGVNTYLTPEPPREIARIDRSAIGRHAFIAQLPTLYPGLESSRDTAEFGQPIARINGAHAVPSGTRLTLDGSGSAAPTSHTIRDYRWTIVNRPS